MAGRSRRSLLSLRGGIGFASGCLLLGAVSTAPLDLETLDGDPVVLAPEAGRALVVHFWATWCPSCADELPALAAARAGCAGEVEIALVDVAEDADEIRSFLAEQGLVLDPLRDPRGRVWRESVGARGLPANLLWTADGERRTELGPRSREAWRALLAELGCRGTLQEP